MAIEPVANQIRPIEAPDVMGSFVNALRVRNAVEESRMAPLRRAALESENRARDVETKTRQRSLDAATAIANAFQKNTSVGNDGAVAVNHAGVMKDLTDNGWGPEALKVDADRRANLKAAYEQEEALTKLNSAKAGRLGALAGSVVSAMRNAGDTDEQRKIAYERTMPQAVSTALGERLITPEHANSLLQHPYSPDAVGQFEEWANGAMNYKDQLDAFHKNMEESRARMLAEDTHNANVAKLPGEQADAAQKQRANWFTQFANAGDPDQYAALLDQAPHAIAVQAEARVPRDQFDRFESASTLRDMGLSAEQATQAEQRRTSQEATDAYRKSTEAWRTARLGFEKDKFAQQNANGGRPMTAGQRKVEERNIFNEENGTTTRPGLNTQRLRIGNVLRDGKDPKTGSALTPQQRADWQAQYDGATNSLQAIQFRKAELYGVPRPGQQQVADMKEGEDYDAGDGQVWKKQGGVVFYQGQGVPVAPKSTTPQPASTPAPPLPATPATPTPTQGAPKPAADQPNPDEVISVKLPNGKYLTGARAKVEQALKDAGYQMK